jgi:hypothetical protein
MKEQTKGILLACLIVVAAFVWYLERRDSSTEVASSQIAGDLTSYKPLAVENPALQREKQAASRKTEYKGGGRDLFSEMAPPPVVVAQKEERHAAVGPVPLPPPPPPALPGNVKFFGYGTVPNGSAKRAFLSDGEQIYIVAEGDTLLGKYRVVKIGNANLDFEEIASGRRGSAALTEESVTAPAS